MRIFSSRWAVITQILVCATLSTFCTSVKAQQAKKIPRIGYLSPRSLSGDSERSEVFRQELRELGYVEGRNILIEYRYAEGKLDRLPDLAVELVGLKVDLIVATSDFGVRAAKDATKTIPIVFVGSSDPVGDGFVTSLAQPGGTATGSSILYPELSAKRLELFKEAFPKISRLAVLTGPRGLYMKEQKLAAQALGIQIVSFPVKALDDIDSVFVAIRKEGIHALLTNPNPIINTAQNRIVELAVKNRLPAMYAAPEFVDAGGLMFYGPSYADIYRRAAIYADKILKSAKPADLPVEQPTKFELLVNLKTAKQIGVIIPQSVLIKADRVIR
jgi:putative ABC transport system substrate-binding protein